MVDRVAERLHDLSVGTLVEVGVGTGRISVPLSERHLLLTGVDISRPMLRRAWAKGLHRVVQASAYRLPFPAGEFDGALFVHVLHILDNPRNALLEAGRVSRRGVFAMLAPGRPTFEDVPDEEDPRRLLAEELRSRGYSTPAPGRPGDREAALLELFPPSEVWTLSDRWVTEPMAKPLDMVERRATRHFRDVPPEILLPAVAEIRQRLGTRTRTFHEVRKLAHWASTELPAPQS
ncbi:MAG TPA: class I SAM-dependent methyltransferase [Thermoplasmata archaeon]|nr:class I SAM-dependent methyltransferase [Thermoplasmata archaeon]